MIEARAAGKRDVMTILCYSQRLLNPFRGSICCIQYRSAEAVTADGLKWDIYVSNEALLADLPPGRRTQVSDIRYGSWTAKTGLKRGPLYPSDDFLAMESMGAVVYEHLLALQDRLPFPFLDRFELWLLDRAGRPLALLESALSAEAVDLRRAVRPWTPGLDSRRTFRSRTTAGLGFEADRDGAASDYLGEYINACAGETPALQVFARHDDGSGSGLHGVNLAEEYRGRHLPADDFPEFLLDTRHHDGAHRELLDEFIAWQTPWLLLLPSLPETTRSRCEELARCQPLKVAKHYRLYPETINRELIDAARVEARLRATAAEPGNPEPVLTTFYIELSPEVAK